MPNMKRENNIAQTAAEFDGFSKETIAKFNEIKNHFPAGKEKSAIIRMLHLAQTEVGWLSTEAMDALATFLNIQTIEVYEVATFYTMFHVNPVGKHVFEVCRTGPCMLVGSDQIIDYISEKLNIKVGETTVDGEFTLKTVECLGACGYAPVLQCKYKFHENLTKDKVDELIEAYRSGIIEN
jgi:NADH-quinone oxidoreductase subunit E